MRTHSLIPLLTLALLGLILSTTIVVAAPQAKPGQWWVDYFDNTGLSGGPILSRYEDVISHNWGLGSPHNKVPKDNFSARWVRDEWFGGGTYRFSIASDDGVRMWVGDQLIVDEWRDRSATPLTIDRYIPPGTYQVRVEYYDHVGAATIGVSWGRVVGGTTWQGEYYDNKNLSGAPALVRSDGAVDFIWGTGGPDPAIPVDNFSVRWTRALNFNAGTYRFFASTDDGVRLLVDGNLTIDAWYKQKLPNTHTADVYLAAGQHTITVEYYEQGGEAHAHVWWQLQGASYGNWHGAYFDNPNLVGGPVLERNDAEVNFDWGVGAPVDWMPDDNFSIRWARTVNFAPGYYRFVVLADDGFRLWLDDGLFIDKWQDMVYELHYVDGTYLQGQHTVRLEYYDHTGGARVRFWWENSSDGNAPPTYVPASSYGATSAFAPPSTQPPSVQPPSPQPPADEDDPWEASYYPNANLKGEPALTRIETSLDHNWGWGSPAGVIPKDRFSARWTQPLHFRAGTYRFTTYTDDGVRLWVDGRLLIDNWRPMRGYRSATVYLTEGVHDVKMEYYEQYGAAVARLTWQRLSN